MLTDDEKRCQDELSDLIYQGRLLMLTNAELRKELPNFRQLILQVEPFKSDKALDLATQAPFFDSKKLNALRLYLTRLQASMKYFPFQSPHHRMPNILDGVAMKDVIQMARGNRLQIEKYKILEKGYELNEVLLADGCEPIPPLVSVQQIRGDGNCYYRAVMRAHIEAIIMMPNPNDRSALFTHMANLFEGELLNNNNSLFLQRKSKHSVEKLTGFIEKLKGAAKGERWSTLQEFSHDLMDDSQQGDDYVMIDAARFLLGQYIYDHMNDVDPKGHNLTFYDYIASEGYIFDIISEIDLRHKARKRNVKESEAEHKKRIQGIIDILSEEEQNEIIKKDQERRFNRFFYDGLLQMGDHANNFYVEKLLLLSILGAKGSNIPVDDQKKADLYIRQNKIEQDLAADFYERYNMADLPKTEVYLQLVPGHYTYFLTAEQHDLRKRCLAEAIAPESFDFNYEPPKLPSPIVPAADALLKRQKNHSELKNKKRNIDGLDPLREIIDEVFDLNLVDNMRDLLRLISEQCRSLRSKHINKLQLYIDYKLEIMKKAHQSVQDKFEYAEDDPSMAKVLMELKNKAVFFEKKQHYWSAVKSQLNEFKKPLDEAYKNPGYFFSRHNVIKKNIEEILKWHDHPMQDKLQQSRTLIRY